MARANTYDQIETTALNLRQVIDGLTNGPSLVLALLADTQPMAMQYDTIADHIFHMTSFRPTTRLLNGSVKFVRKAIRNDAAALRVIKVKNFREAGYGLQVLVETNGKPLHEVIRDLKSQGKGLLRCHYSQE